MQSNGLTTSNLNNGQALASIRRAITDFLRRCGLPHANIANISIDRALYSECYQEVINRGFPMEGKYSLLPYMDIGVAMSHIYAYLPDRATRMWICLFTILLISIDDMMDKGDDLVNMYSFYERFANKQSQGDPVLNALDGLLRDVVCYYPSPVSNLIVTSTFDFISSILLDNETKDMQISTETPLYPDYLRMLSGMPAAYSFFIFPPTVPLQEYIQCMPNLAIIVNHTNDILSCYKEEIEGDTMNYLSRMAVSRGLSKQAALHETIEKTVQAHHNILNYLRPHAEACDAYVKCFHGFAIKFHAALGRYKLEEITSESESSESSH